MADSMTLAATSLGGTLSGMLRSEDIEPGSSLSYQLAKDIYLYHPLGRKMVDSPIALAQSQRRSLAAQDAPPEALKAFEKEWERLSVDKHIYNVHRLARMYGLASIVAGCEDEDLGQGEAAEPLPMDRLWTKAVFFNELDPLNTAGSLVLSQLPNSPNFNRPVTVSSQGTVYPRDRWRVVMNEEPVYLAYTPTAFGFVGRSVYQRALYPLKSYLRSMIANDMIQTKLGLLVAMMQSPGPVVTQQMSAITALKLLFLKSSRTGEVISIGKDDKVETLNMQNVDGAGTYSRGNIIKDIATSADMPAIMLENETLVSGSGFGEGAEDAKNIARYIETQRAWMQPVYAWFDNVVQYRAWNPEFFGTLVAKYGYNPNGYREVFLAWRESFAAEWPSFLIEPESERIKVQDVQLQAIVAVLQTLLPELDPPNKMKIVDWAQRNINENRLLFKREMDLDLTTLDQHFQEQQEHEQEVEMEKAQNAGMGGPGGEGGDKPEEVGPEAKKFGKFDQARRDRVQRALDNLGKSVLRLVEK